MRRREVELVLGIGKVIVGVHKLPVQEDHPSQLMDDEGVILVVKVNDETLRGAACWNSPELCQTSRAPSRK